VPIIATAGESKSYTPAPEGTHHAVCVDVIDLGQLPNSFKPGTTQHKVNKRFLVYKRYTLSLNEKANLRHDLESWRGRPFTREEEMGFDVETVKGANCLVNIQHKQSADKAKTYANVVSVMPLIKGMAKITPEAYERHQEETPQQDAPAEEAPVELDDIPF
jgi:hypothetical protein